MARLPGAVHARGVVVRDLSPNNLLIDDEGEFRLVDLELAHLTGGGPPVHERGGTPGFSAPEQFQAAAPALSADLYALGAVLFFLATATTAELLPDKPDGRSHQKLIAARLHAPRRPVPVPAEVSRLLLELLREDPTRRPALAQVRAYLIRNRPGAAAGRIDLWRQPPPEQTYDRPRRLPAAHSDALLDGAVAHLAATADLAAERIWRGTSFGDEAEPCAVQYGAGGVLAALARLHRHRPSAPAERLVRQTSEWITRHLSGQEHRLSGLYFGAAGTALALPDAGTLLDRPETVRLARATLAALPRRWPNPDITHGTAGFDTTTSLLSATLVAEGATPHWCVSRCVWAPRPRCAAGGLR